MFLARALLYCTQTVDGHGDVLRAAFQTEPPRKRLRRLAERTVCWTSTRPQPRLKELVSLLQADALMQKTVQRYALRVTLLDAMPAPMRCLPGFGPLQEIRTVQGLGEWLRLDPEHLRWFADLRDLNRNRSSPLLCHYECRVLAKPYGTIRLIEAPKQRLKSLQRQILREILDRVPLHGSVHGFCRGRSIVTFAAPHAGRAVVLRVDLKDFFPSITGPRVQALFRTLGYPETVADLLGGLSTTTTGRGVWRNTGLDLSAEELARARQLYGQPHLPQGAPTSPALANLCAFRLDRRLTALARAAGAAYTRYADDLAFSGEGAFARRADRFGLEVASIIAEEGFRVHPRKTRLMRSSARQHLVGLTVNVQPNVPRHELERLEAVLWNCVRYGPASQNRDRQMDFRRHLEGKVAFAAMVGTKRAGKLRGLLERIVWAEPR